jgi:hypothetical protein
MFEHRGVLRLLFLEASLLQAHLLTALVLFERVLLRRLLSLKCLLRYSVTTTCETADEAVLTFAADGSAEKSAS